ncbi:hypothetical protein LXA43DRAFT_1059130, partial [Ganoderma leucocontextum]
MDPSSYPHAIALGGYQQAPPDERLSSTVDADGLTLTSHRSIDYSTTQSTSMSSEISESGISDLIYKLSSGMISRSDDRDPAERSLETFVGRICMESLRFSAVEKRRLLIGETSLRTAIFALTKPVSEPSADNMMSAFRAQLKDTLTVFHQWCLSWSPTYPSTPFSEVAASNLFDQAVVALQRDRKEWVHVLLHVFGRIPELWGLHSSLDNSDASPSGVVEDLTDGKGKGTAAQTSNPGTSHAQYARAVQGTPLAPQSSTSIASSAPVQTSDASSVRDTTATTFPAGRPTTYHPPTAAGTSQPELRPTLPWGHGTRSAGDPPVPASQQPQIVHHQPAHPAIPAVSVQDASASIFQQSSLAQGPSAATSDLSQLADFNPFDLSLLASMLPPFDEDFLLPEMADLDEATARLERNWRGSSYTDSAAQAPVSGSQGLTQAAQVAPELVQSKLAQAALANDLARY